MRRETLESAFNEALKQQQARSPELRIAVPEVRENASLLLRALLHSATGMDKIVQRRIGLEQEPVLSLN